MTDPFSIAGKRCLVTGGTAGIGLAVARHFREAGAEVVISGRRDDGAATAAELGAQFVRMDVSDSDSVRSGTAAAAELLGGTIDVLVLNAGIALDTGSADALNHDAMRRTFEVNVFGVADGIDAGLKHLATDGNIIVTSSPACSTLMPGAGVYSASKAAVNAILRTAAIELGPRGIRVNAVLPGVIRTEMALDPDTAEEELQMLSTLTATGRIREPEEIAPVFRFLASAASAACTGALIECEDGVRSGFSLPLWEKAFGADAGDPA
jgi:NAD(P)-dependent dehydrogenase (short-subunit alcohol dehydrogenase family)